VRHPTEISDFAVYEPAGGVDQQAQNQRDMVFISKTLVGQILGHFAPPVR